MNQLSIHLQFQILLHVTPCGLFQENAPELIRHRLRQFRFLLIRPCRSQVAL